MATDPLDLYQFKDCITNNYGNWDNDCVLQSGEYLISEEISISRSNITVDGAWPWPTLRRYRYYTGDLMKTTPGISWVNVKNIYFHGNRWDGATSNSSELNLSGCSYCQVLSNALFIGSPKFGLAVDPSVPTAVYNVNFQGAAIGGIYSGGGAECADPVYWYPRRCLFVNNSYFYNNGANAIGFAPKNAQIYGNSFSYNHSECPYGAPGGQIDLDRGSDKVDVIQNTFEYGPSCANGFHAGGVEIHGTRITLTDNTIRYNAADGVAIGDGSQYVTVSSSNPATYPITNNNRKGYGDFCGGAGFPAVKINAYSEPGRPATSDITVSNVWAVGGHTYGVLVTSCFAGGTPIQRLNITNNCVAGNLLGGVNDSFKCGPSGNQSCVGSSSTISNNPTSGCGGY